MKTKLIEIFGWYGALAIVIAYALISFSIFDTTSIWYQLLNGTGALGIVVVSLHKKANQPALLNIVWTLIAIVAILRILFN